MRSSESPGHLFPSSAELLCRPAWNRRGEGPSCGPALANQGNERGAAARAHPTSV